jgi:hypothetical protein
MGYFKTIDNDVDLIDRSFGIQTGRGRPGSDGDGHGGGDDDEMENDDDERRQC